MRRWLVEGRTTTTVYAIDPPEHATHYPAEVSVFEPVGVAAEGDDFGMVDEPVDHRCCDDFVAERLASAAERLV